MEEGKVSFLIQVSLAAREVGGVQRASEPNPPQGPSVVMTSVFGADPVLSQLNYVQPVGTSAVATVSEK